MDYKVKDNVKKTIFEDILSVVNTDIPWDMIKGSNVLITGANGFIGFYLTTALLLRNDLYNEEIKVAALVRNKNKAEIKFGKLADRDDLMIITRDVCDNLNQLSSCFTADYIIHAASQASAHQFEADPVGTINANLIGTDNILRYSLECNTKSTLFISSLKVYGTVYGNNDSLKESDTGYIDHTSYKNCYAMGKRAAETLCGSYSKQYDLPVKIVRPSYIYGASSLDDDRVWAQFIANVVKNENILLKSNGAAYRSFCYVTDTASAIFTVLLLGENITPYNISAKHSDVTIRNFAKKAVDIFPERNLKLNFANPEHEKEPVKSSGEPIPEILDSSRLKALGWSAIVDLKEGIKRSINILEESAKENTHTAHISPTLLKGKYDERRI